ncbi:MAG TPA: hypothetical protein VIM56_09795 [Rhizomicrobium sp.]
MKPIWALNGLRWSYCAFIAWTTLQTLLAAREGGDVHALILSGVELAASAAFLLPSLEVIACAVLLAVYVIAAGLTVTVHHEVPLRFAYFAMTAICVVAVTRAVPKMI